MNARNENSRIANAVTDSQHAPQVAEERGELIEALFEKAEAYIQTSISLYKLKAIDKLVQVVALWITHLLLLFIFCFFLVLFSIGVAIWIGNQMGTSHYGYMIVAGAYLLLFALVWFLGKGMMKKIVGKRVLPELLK